MPSLKDDLLAAHAAPDAYAGGKPNAALADLDAQLRSALDDGDDALDHKVAYFAEQLKDYALRAKRKAQRKRNEKNEDFLAVEAELADTRQRLAAAEARLAEVKPEQAANADG